MQFKKSVSKDSTIKAESHALVKNGTSEFAPKCFRQWNAVGTVPGLAPANPYQYMGQKKATGEHVM